MPEDLQGLIKEAYANAERQGRANWRRMNIGVLKNRLILLTGGQFSEKAYGKEKFGQLIRGLPDLVRVDDSTVPPTVEWIGSPLDDASTPTTPTPDRRRIRPDLWKAMVDYSSGKRYVWDDAKGVAREAEGEELDDILPTITQPEMSEWRASFVAAVASDVPPTERLRLEEWQAKGLTDAALPARIRGEWYAHLKGRLEERLNKWFEGRSTKPTEVAPEPNTVSTAIDVEALRKVIMECVEAMTPSELERLPLPAGALLRVLARRTDRGS